jgi:hypothetical protein
MTPRRLDPFRRRLAAERADANRRIGDRQHAAAGAVDPDGDRQRHAAESHQADLALAFAQRRSNLMR